MPSAGLRQIPGSQLSLNSRNQPGAQKQYTTNEDGYVEERKEDEEDSDDSDDEDDYLTDEDENLSPTHGEGNENEDDGKEIN